MKTFIRNLSLLLIAGLSIQLLSASGTDWPSITVKARPGVRWWWPGNAVDENNLTWNLEELTKAGIGTVEITPIYGVKGNEANEIEYLSPKWMQMLKFTESEASRLGMQVDMNNGTGWPFGGPQIDTANAATCRFVQKYTVNALPGKKVPKQKIAISVDDKKQNDVAKLQVLLFVGSDGLRRQIPVDAVKDDTLECEIAENGTIYALFSGRTFQQVKRAATGGEGLVMNHFSKDALNVYLKRFDDAFGKSGMVWPNTFFNDSYEVYKADWSDDFLEEFKARRGYDLADYIPEFVGDVDSETCARIVCDYRETISEMLLANFTIPWTEWAHNHGALTRNQAHGSPGNLLDLYAAVDIPECESYGITSFDIPGFRLDSVRKPSDSNPVTLKYASSAAHVSGKQLTSAESMTWLTEHFRTSLFQIKPEMDQLFLNGINRIYYHGSPYTPKDAPWPGWLFYASILVNPNNTIFRDMPALNDYASRVQSFMQIGKPDNEALMYLPIYDIWQEKGNNNYLAFDIIRLSKKMPGFEKIVLGMREHGYDVDYISDNQIAESKVEDNSILTEGGKYKVVVVPDCKYMPVVTLKKLARMASDGATVAFLGRLPDDVPGLDSIEFRCNELKSAIDGFGLPANVSGYFGKPFGKGMIMLGNNIDDMLKQASCAQEEISSKFGAGFIRRRMNDGFTYFVAMQKNKTIDGWVKLGVNAKSAMIFNPLTGEKGKANLSDSDGKPAVYIQLKPGQSLIIRTFDNEDVNEPLYPVYMDSVTIYPQDKYNNIMFKLLKVQAKPMCLKGNWTFSFTNGEPAIPGVFNMTGDPVSWTTLNVKDASDYAGTGRYTLNFRMPYAKADDWMLDLGMVSESARITINGQPAGIAWSLPFTINVGKYLLPGKLNKIEIDVTNLPANRIADYDRRGVDWRIFREINFVDVNYQKTKYDKWPVMPSGLTQPVKLIPLFLENE